MTGLVFNKTIDSLYLTEIFPVETLSHCIFVRPPSSIGKPQKGLFLIMAVLLRWDGGVKGCHTRIFFKDLKQKITDGHEV